MNTQADYTPLGHEITDFEVRGQEQDGQENWIGADIVLRIAPVGHFFLNVVTSEEFANQVLYGAHDDIDHPERLLDEPSASETRPPYVLNHDVITDEVLEEAFKGRRVGPDLAKCLFYLGPFVNSPESTEG